MKDIHLKPVKKQTSGERNRRFNRLFFARSLVLGFVFCAAVHVAAQDEDARIYHVEGVDFALTLGGERAVFPADAAKGDGIRLERSGIIHTGAGTFLEMQLIPSGTVIKLSENTSLVYNGIDETGKFADLGLLYGRIRVVTGNGANSAGSNSVVVRGGGVSARIQEGDLGVDYMLEPDGGNSAPRPLFRVYAFRGGAEVFPYGKGGSAAYFGGVQTLAAEERECLFVDISSSYTFAEKKPLDKSIIDYWAGRGFAGSPPIAMPDTAIAAAVEEAPAASPPPVYETSANIIPLIPAETGPAMSSVPNNRKKNLLLGIGLCLTASAAAIQGISYSQFDTSNDGLARNYFIGAYGPLAFGLITTLTGLLFNPSGSGN